MDTSSPGHNLVVDDYDPIPVSLAKLGLALAKAKLGLALASAAGSCISEFRCPLPHHEARMEQTV
jgi:hypothetical protein